MTDKELIARLREAVNGEHDMTPHGADCLQAADRIEALTVENAYLERVVKDLSDEVNLAEQEACMLENDFIKTDKEIDALKAKLAKAVESLRNIRELNMTAEDENGHQWANSDLIEQEIGATLAEIEGEQP